MGYGNSKTPSMQRRLGSATLSRLVFPRESNPNFPWEKFHWDNTVLKKKLFIAQIATLLILSSVQLSSVQFVDRLGRPGGCDGLSSRDSLPVDTLRKLYVGETQANKSEI